MASVFTSWGLSMHALLFYCRPFHSPHCTLDELL